MNRPQICFACGGRGHAYGAKRKCKACRGLGVCSSEVKPAEMNKWDVLKACVGNLEALGVEDRKYVAECVRLWADQEKGSSEKVGFANHKQPHPPAAPKSVDHHRV